MNRIVIFFGLVILMGGCVHNTFKETLYEGGEVVTVTEYDAVTVHVPFGKDSGSSHDFEYKWGQGNVIQTGQAESGADSTGQVQAIGAVGDLIGNIAAKVLEGYLGYMKVQTGSGDTASGESGVSMNDQIAGLLKALTGLKEEISALKGK